jgi:SAM-dependent methyltransferase
VASAGDKQREALSGMAVHAGWNRDYHTKANEEFYDEAFDRFLKVIDPPADASFLDAGCGPCYHAMRLASRGYNVTAIDFSAPVVEQARETVRDAGYSDRIDVRRGSVVELDMADATWHYVVCWGVLMHIPDVRKAVAELARVTAEGGWVVVSEADFRSFDDRLLGTLRRIRGRQSTDRTDAGVESWWESPNGSVLTRHADIGWLEAEFAGHGMKLVRTLPGQFTELYTHRRLAPISPALTWFNRAWARTVTSPVGALGKILLFQKT